MLKEQASLVSLDTQWRVEAPVACTGKPGVCEGQQALGPCGGCGSNVHAV